MRKFTLLFALVAFTSFLFAQTAKKESCELTKGDPVQLTVKKSATMTKDAGDVYWEEHFDAADWETSTADAMPENWKVFDSNNENFYWVWTNEGPKGRYTSLNDAVKEEMEPRTDILEAIDNVGGTGTTGALMINGDWYNTAEDGSMVAEPIAMDSWVQVTNIDLSDAVGATFKYNQMYRWCCSGTDQLSVFVANDYDATLDEDAQSPHWFELDSRGLLGAVNEYTFGIDRNMQFDISGVAAGASNVTIRVHVSGPSHYFWVIDDFQIVEPNTYDVVAKRAWWYYAEEPYTGEGAEVDLDWTGGYTKIPVSQAQDFVGFKMAVKNFGIADLEEVQLNVEVLKDGTEVYNETGDKVAIPSTYEDSVDLNVAFTPAGIGEYQVSSTVIFEETDEDLSNNAFGYNFEVTEGTYSRVYDAPYDGRTMTGAWVSGGNPGDGMVTKFDIYEDVIIESVTTFFWDNSDEEQIADINAGNYSMIGRLYKVDEEGEVPNTPVISTELREMVVADTMTFVTMNFIADGEAEYLTPGEYYVGIETYTSSVDIDFEIADDRTLQQPGDNSLCWFSGELYGVVHNPVINMNIVPSEGFQVTFNVDIAEMYITDPANDVVVVKGDFEGGELVLTDDDNDFTYTGSIRLANGDYEYNYYINDVVEEGAAREFTVAGAALEINDNIVTVGEIDLTTVSIYPNPTENELHITNMNGVDRIIISNIIGQEVMNITGFERNVDISTSNLENGVYIVTFIDVNNNMQSTRIVKK